MGKNLVIGAVIVVVGAVFLLLANNATRKTAPKPTGVVVPSPTPTPTSMTVTLAAENNSGESGTALLEEQNGKTVVTVNLTGAPASTPQPAHIHTGACPGVGAIKYPLTNVVDGKSVTTLDLTLEELKTQGPLALNVHKSAQEVKVYVACGALSEEGSMKATPSASTTKSTY